jgi:hypothetical protein
MRTVLLTGYSKTVAETRGLVNSAFARWLPVRFPKKNSRVSAGSLSVDGKTVAMVGDGANDAPARHGSCSFCLLGPLLAAFIHVNLGHDFVLNSARLLSRNSPTTSNGTAV